MANDAVTLACAKMRGKLSSRGNNRGVMILQRESAGIRAASDHAYRETWNDLMAALDTRALHNFAARRKDAN
jgi:hypothetical protein